MTFEDALQKLKTNPKNSGVSETILKGVATRIAKTLPEAASADDIETRFNEEQEFAVEMQAENDRRVSTMKKELDELKTPPIKKPLKTDKTEEPGDLNAIEANGLPRWYNLEKAKEAETRKTSDEAAAQKAMRDKSKQEVAKELGISDKQLGRILIKDDEDVRTVLTEWKQEAINESIPDGGGLIPTSLSSHATDKEEATRLVDKFKAK